MSISYILVIPNTTYAVLSRIIFNVSTCPFEKFSFWGFLVSIWLTFDNICPISADICQYTVLRTYLPTILTNIVIAISIAISPAIANTYVYVHI